MVDIPLYKLQVYPLSPYSDEEDQSLELQLKATRDQLREKERAFEEVEKQRLDIERQKLEVESELSEAIRQQASLRQHLDDKEPELQRYSTSQKL